MKKILILGSNGFIGKNLKEYLLQSDVEYELFLPSRLELDLLDEKAVKSYLRSTYFDVIINAAVCNPVRGNDISKKSEIEQDLRMYFNLRKYNNLYGKMLYFGSGAEFDKSKNIVSVSEDDFLNDIPHTQYGFAKYIIGKDIENSDNIYNLRIFGLFGKYENWKTTFISGACCKALKGLPITIRQNVYFDYLYIDDFCKIVEWFVNNTPQYHTYNVTSGEKIDLVTIAQIINTLSDIEVPVYVCKEGLANEYTASNKRLLKEYGNKINGFTKEEAIAALMEYYKKNIDIIDLYSLLYE